MMPLSFLTSEVTDDSMNFSVRNTKKPPASAAAMGKPTSMVNFKKSIIYEYLSVLGHCE
jgi:hypothetical protein